MSTLGILAALGFETGRLRFTLRTAAAAVLAIFVAWLFGLEHPQWSGMTVWAASQPVRGQLLEKSLFRGAGTVIGSIVGIALLFAAQDHLWLTVAGLAVWTGICAGVGNIVRGFASYGAMLAGYSAAMVVLLHSSRSQSLLAVGVDRMLTVLCGIAVALAVGWLFATTADPDDPARRARRVTQRILAALAGHFAKDTRLSRADQQELLSEIVDIEAALDTQEAGTFRTRDRIRAIRKLLSTQVAALLWMRRALPERPDPRLIAALRAASAASDDKATPAELEGTLRTAAKGAAQSPVLREALTGLAEAAARERATETGNPMPDANRDAVILHRDWVGAREALTRSTCAMLLVGAFWLLTGWQYGGFMLLGTAIMTTIFSTVDHPAATLQKVILGQSLGVFGALACRWFVWPFAENELQLVLLLVPFIVFGGFLLAHRRGAGPIGFDYNMVVLLLSQPAWPLGGSLAGSLTAGVAVVLGPLSGLLAFLMVFPVNGRKRLDTIVAMMVREIEALAAQHGAHRRRRIWRARLYHRLMQLVRWTDKTGQSRDAVVEGAFATLLLGSAVLHIDEVLGDKGLPAGTRKRLRGVLDRLTTVGREPRRAARMLATAARRFADDPGIDNRLLEEAAMELLDNADFVERPRGPGMRSTRRPLPVITGANARARTG